MMWKSSSIALFGALIGLGFGVVQFPQWESVMFPIISVTAGLFILCFSQSILEQ